MLAVFIILILMNVYQLVFGCSFDSQYLGNYLTLDEYNNLDIACENKLCLNDAKRLLLVATQNKTIGPCDDFKEFALGEFIKYRALNDRYRYVGFDNDVQLLHWERQRKVLAATVKNNDIRPLRIAKNYFQKCVTSNDVRENGASEILNYLRSLGGAPLINSSWDESNFKVMDLFHNATKAAIYIFLNHQIARCPHPHNKSEEIICIKYYNPWNHSVRDKDDFIEMLVELNIDKSLSHSTAHQVAKFLLQRLDLLENKGLRRILTVSSLNEFTKYSLNWLQMINSQLTKEAQVVEEIEILIEHPEMIQKFLELMEVTPITTLANYFAVEFLYEYKFLFIVYPFDKQDEKYIASKKSYQRWERCRMNLKNLFRPTLEALYAQRYFNEQVQESVKDLTKEVVRDIVAELYKSDTVNNTVKHEVDQKLSTIKYIIGYPDEILNLEKVEEFYEDLDLDGTEGSVETFLKIEDYNQKIENDPITSWKRKLNSLSGDDDEIKLDLNENILYIPPMLIHYPFYHPNRSRFFNTATLFDDIAYNFVIGLKDELEHKWNLELPDDEVNYAYNNYVNWEKMGGNEYHLPGFFLTNTQMFWLAIANKKYRKFHQNVITDYNRRIHLQMKYFHLFFKTKPEFRDAFNCSEMTKEENEMYKMFINERRKLVTG
ncbi:unnamed protein product [Diamesa serratosioi]